MTFTAMNIGPGGSWSPQGSESCPRRIKLTPFFQRYHVAGKTDGFRFRVEASDACAMPNEIFRYYQHPTNPVTGETVSEFTGVCSLPDLEEFPVGEPRDTDCPKVFRLPYFDIVVRSVHQAYELWSLVQEEVLSLKETLDAHDVLVPGDSVWIGDVP